MNLAMILGLALAASLAGNAWLGGALVDAGERAVALQKDFDQAAGAARACNKGVQELQDQARDRDREHVRAREKAQQYARTHEQRAQQILIRPPSTPGDDCKSARDRAQAWLKSRGKP